MGYIGSRQYNVLQAAEHTPTSARGISHVTGLDYGDVNKTLLALLYKGWVTRNDEGIVAISQRGTRTLKDARKKEK